MTNINELRQRMAENDDDRIESGEGDEFPPTAEDVVEQNQAEEDFQKMMGTIKAEMSEMDACPGCKRSIKKCGLACKFHREHSGVNFEGKEPSSWRTRGAKLKTRLARIYYEP